DRAVCSVPTTTRHNGAGRAPARSTGVPARARASLRRGSRQPLSDSLALRAHAIFAGDRATIMRVHANAQRLRPYGTQSGCACCSTGQWGARHLMSSRRGARAAAIAMALSVAAVGVARAASIDIGSAAGVPGSDVVVEVSLRTMGAAVEGTQNRINFDRQTFVPARAGGQPDCTVNPAIHKNGTAFRFLPVDCDPAVDCTALRAFFIAFDTLDTIRDRSVLYSCRIAIAAVASEGTHVLHNSETRASGVV